MEDRITHDGNGYVRRTGISNNVTADKGNFEREKRFVGAIAAMFDWEFSSMARRYA